MKLKRTAKKEVQNIEWHLQDHRTRKWLVQCVVCQKIGYKHDAPDSFFGREHIIAYFKPLVLNQNGVCEQCQNGIEI
jgi:hypothetical protein